MLPKQISDLTSASSLSATDVFVVDNASRQTRGITAAIAARDSVINVLNIVSVKSYGAVGDGVTNDTTSFNNAITAANAIGASLYVPPSASAYMINPIFITTDKTTIIGVRGKSILRRNGSVSGNALVNVSGDDCYFEGIEFDGNKTVASTVDANVVTLSSACNSATFKDCGFINANGTNSNGTGSGLLIVGDYTVTSSRYSLQDCYAYGNENSGYTNWYGNNVTWLNCEGYSNSRLGLEAVFTSGGSSMSNCSVLGGSYYLNGTSGIAIGNFSSGGIYTHANPTAKNFDVIGVKAFSNANYGLAIYGDGHTVSDNACNNNNTTNGSAGGIVFSPSNSICSNNVCKDNGTGGGYGIDSGGAAYCTITGNICDNNYINFGPGGSIGTVLSHNVSRNAQATGIYVIPVEGGAGGNFPYACRNLVISNNIIDIDNSGVWGVQIVHGCEDLKFNNNSFYISGTGRLQDCLFWNAHQSSTLNGNTWTAAATSNYAINPSGGTLLIPDFQEFVYTTTTAPTISTVTTWSRDVIADGVAFVNPTAGGSGYTTATVGFSGGGGSGAAATARIYNGAVIGYNMTSYGTGYTSTPTVTITGDGSGATATARVTQTLPNGHRVLLHFNDGAVVTNSATGITNCMGKTITFGPQEWLEMTTIFGVPRMSSYISDTLNVDKTLTAGGTTGAQTINKGSGSVNFAAAASSLVVTNSLVTANSVILLTLMSSDVTAKSASATAGSGSFTINLNAAATAETRVAFVVLN